MMTETRAGDWMQTHSGKQFWPLDPRIEEIDIEDIAHALSMICRYGGHATKFYSVAEHCWHMSYAVEPQHAMWALLHDATEAYVGDMVRPLKRFMPDYCEAEDKIMALIAEKYGLKGTVIPPEVKLVDTRILLDEKAAVMTPTEHSWNLDGIEPLGIIIDGFPAGAARIMWINRFEELRATMDATTLGDTND